LEGAHFLKYGELKTFSEQQLVDCSTEWDGCDGGDINFDFYQRYGAESESDYPYTAKDGRCK